MPSSRSNYKITQEITHRALLPNHPTRRGNLTGRKCLNMERNTQEELKAHLMETNEEFRRLASQHLEFASKLDALEALPHLTHEEQLEETRLKKLKLRLKDQMEAMLSQFRSRQVA
jgi:uncharacterized protein YdcH (DUF465 family)